MRRPVESVNLSCREAAKVYPERHRRRTKAKIRTEVEVWDVSFQRARLNLFENVGIARNEFPD